MKERIKLIVENETKYRIDVSKKACHKFGFYSGDRIFIPFGYNREATVVGVCDGRLWFYIDGHSNIKTTTFRNKEEHETNGIKLVSRAPKGVLK